MGYKWKDNKLMFSKRLIALCVLIILISCGENKKVGMTYKEYIYNENGRIVPPNQNQLKSIPKDGGDMWNRLVFEKSPYLLQHSANPVDWYPWTEEAFDLAKKLNKPVFLSIGYTTCHWCHVMEHESFEDSLVASLMNDAFVNIKVDREERPDIDNIYMEVTQMVTGRGGWPMTIIMTPDKKPFFAGTYFPKNTRYKRTGMVDLVPQIKELWKDKQDSILQSANKITNTLKNRNNNRLKKIDLVYKDILDKAFNIFKQNFDKTYGGFKNSRNKFPKPHDYSFLSRYYNRTKNNEALNIVNKSLYAMKMGGMYDQIGFGFHRYSTDKKWLVPHFEKMLYDQAMLIHAYLDAYLITKDDFYKNTIEEISEYVLRDMVSKEGGFYSAEDADSQGEEGVFYIWKTLEIRELLSTEEYDYIYDILEFNDSGNCKVEGHYTNIPHFKLSWEEIAKKYNLTKKEAIGNYHTVRDKIFNFREQRVHPQKDDKILTDWNGLMISALARAGAVLNNKKYINAAEKSANFIKNNLVSKDGTLLKSYRQGATKINGMIEDYAFLIWGLIELYEATFKEEYISSALSLSDYQLANFWDKKNGGFFFTSSSSKKLIIRNKEIYDGAIPSGNSVSAYNYIRLSRILSKPEYEDISHKIIDSFSSNLSRYSSGYTMLLHTLDFIEGPSYEVIVVGNKTNSTEIMNSLYNNNQFNKIIIFKDEDEKLHSDFKFLENYFSEDKDKATVYVCKDYVCNLPTSDFSLINRQLQE